MAPGISRFSSFQSFCSSAFALALRRSPAPRARGTSRPAAHPTAARPGRRCASAAGTPRSRPSRVLIATRAARCCGNAASSSGSIATSIFSISSRVAASFMRAGSKAARRTLPCVSAVATTYLSEKRASAGVARRLVAATLPWRRGSCRRGCARSRAPRRFMRACSASAPSIAAKVWPQQVWFLKVMRQMLNVFPKDAKALLPIRPVRHRARRSPHRPRSRPATR